MSEDEFWAVVADSRVGVDALPREKRSAEQNRRYRARLSAMSPDELVAFRRALELRMRAAHTWDLWAAAHLVCDGCSAGTFRDFRAWLIARGREVFEAAVRDPDTLGDNAQLKAALHPVYPAFWSMPWQVYHEKTGAADFPDLGLPDAGDPTGRKFDEEDEDAIQARLPRLFEAYRGDS